MMTYHEALDYLYSFTDYGNMRTYRYSAETFDLSRMAALMDRLGNPQHRYPSVHVAGTKGKGSTCALMESALRAAGYRAGLYTSPHLQDFCERICVNGEQIPPQVVAALAEEIRPIVEQVPGLTTFELTTALAFLYFARREVDIAVIEVGLGGRLDATNIITPLASVITSLSYDHTHLLGTTLTEIAGEKAGIVKPGVPVVSAPQAEEALAVIERVAEERRAPLTVLGCEWLYAAGRRSLSGQTFFIWSADEQQHLHRLIDEGYTIEWAPPRYEIPLLGDHQIQNASLAVAALHEVRRRWRPLAEEAIRRGFREVQWPGRFEVLARHPYVVADSAHNRDSAQKLAAAAREYFPGSRVVLIFGASADKDVSGMFDELLPNVGHVIATQAVHPRALDAEGLADLAHAKGAASVEALSPVAAALERALSVAGSQDLILATGSLFVVAEVRAAALADAGRRLTASEILEAA